MIDVLKQLCLTYIVEVRGKVINEQILSLCGQHKLGKTTKISM